VQQSRARNTEVVFPPKAAMQTLRSFAQWLPRHAALVKSIAATAGYGPAATLHGQPYELHLKAAQQLLQQAMQAAAAAAARPNVGLEEAAGVTAAAAALVCSDAGLNAVAQQQQQQHCWRLASFTGDLPWAPDMLPLLPAHSLTELTLVSASPNSPSEQLSQLTRLRSLQSLSFDSTIARSMCWLPDGCLAGLAQLSRLTTLVLMGNFKGGILSQLQQLLTYTLPLQRLDLGLQFLDSDRLPALSIPTLTHLTCLQEFNTVNTIPEGVALPTQLRKLRLSPQSDASEVMRVVLPLQGLTHLHVYPHFTQPQPEATELLELSRLPKLDTLVLHYCGVTGIHEALRAAKTWSLVPQLKELCRTFGWVFFWPLRPGSMEGRMQYLLEAAGAAKHLTCLHVSLTGFGTLNRIPVCGILAQLTDLRDLSLKELSITAGDALALTMLTRLTRLELMHLHDGVGVAAATALVRNLPQLHHLWLQSCSIDLQDKDFLVALGRLTQLTLLALGGKGGITAQGLMQLTGLKQLQQFNISMTAEVTDEIKDRFNALLLQC
jgi:hypothetical protein